MGIFKLLKVKKKEEKPQCSCGCSCSASSENKENSKAAKEGELNIKVLGSGCKNCHTLHDNALEAVKELDIKANVEYVTDMARIASYGAMRMPALVVDEKVVSMGKVLKPDEIKSLLQNTGC